MPHEADRNGERGYALISVLLVVSTLAMLAVGIQDLTLTSLRAERATLNAAKVDAYFDAALNIAVLGLLDPRIDHRWRVDGVPREVVFDGITMRISIQDELGRIDLNAADGSVLRSLLLSVGTGAAETDRLVDNILFWRDSSGLTRLHSATNADYAALGYRPRHGALQLVDELGMIIGMTPELLKRIRPALTVYSKVPTVDVAVAPEIVLRGLPGYGAQRADSIIDARHNNVTTDPAQGVVRPMGVISPTTGLNGRVFTVEAEFEFHGRRFSAAYVIQVTRDLNRSIAVLHTN